MNIYKENKRNNHNWLLKTLEMAVLDMEWEKLCFFQIQPKIIFLHVNFKLVLLNKVEVEIYFYQLQ